MIDNDVWRVVGEAAEPPPSASVSLQIIDLTNMALQWWQHFKSDLTLELSSKRVQKSGQETFGTHSELSTLRNLF